MEDPSGRSVVISKVLTEDLQQSDTELRGIVASQDALGEDALGAVHDHLEGPPDDSKSRVDFSVVDCSVPYVLIRNCYRIRMGPDLDFFEIRKSDRNSF